MVLDYGGSRIADGRLHGFFCFLSFFNEERGEMKDDHENAQGFAVGH